MNQSLPCENCVSKEVCRFSEELEALSTIFKEELVKEGADSFLKFELICRFYAKPAINFISNSKESFNNSFTIEKIVDEGALFPDGTILEKFTSLNGVTYALRALTEEEKKKKKNPLDSIPKYRSPEGGIL